MILNMPLILFIFEISIIPYVVKIIPQRIENIDNEFITNAIKS
jgi:hypothetical protein